MATIEATHAAYDILKAFVNDEQIDVDSILQNPALFSVNIHYKQYETSIIAPAAKFIINYQRMIYRLGALLKYGNPNKRLTNAEKAELAIPFKVESGSTNIKPEKILDALKRIVEVIPEKDRIKAVYAIVVVIICGFGYATYSAHLNHHEHMADKDITALAIEKMAESNDKTMEQFAGIINNYEKDTLSNLEEFGEVDYQGETYTSDEIKEIRKKKFPRKNGQVEAKVLEGDFKVINISLEPSYIRIKNKANIEEKVFYRNDLIAEMQGFRERFKEAIDNGGQLFHIKAGYVEKNGKKQEMLLEEMTPLD